MKIWTDDKKWSDKFLVEIKRILGEHLISCAPVEEDTDHNTDLIVLKLDAVRIACRIRRFSYFEKYPNEFTIRSGRPSGVKTELTKIIEGWGDYFFYGFSNKTETGLIAWVLGDLKVFRLWFNREIVSKGGKIPGIPQVNNDGSSCFMAFGLDKMPDKFVVARKEPESATQQQLELLGL